ncbi:MAG: hypothetical protein QM808_08510 [Steroidobacteraceae bacterium]
MKTKSIFYKSGLVMLGALSMSLSMPLNVQAADKAATPKSNWAAIDKWPNFSEGVWDSGTAGPGPAIGTAATAGGPPPGAPGSNTAAAGMAAGANIAAPSGGRAMNIALTEVAKQKLAESRTNFNNVTFASCDPFGFPMDFRGSFQMYFGKDAIFVLNTSDFFMAMRRIYMDGRAHDDPQPSYMGHSIGKWEGDTLVVDTVALVEEAHIIEGLPGNGKTHVVERFKLTGPDTLQVQTTVENSEMLLSPWVTTRTFKRNRSRDAEIPEGYCVNNRDLPEGPNVTPPK